MGNFNEQNRGDSSERRQLWGNANTNTIYLHKANSTNPALWGYSAFNATVEAQTTFQWSGSLNVTSLFQSWVASSSANQPVVFTGDEWSGVYTKKAFSATLSLTYSGNAAPNAATFNPQPGDDSVVVLDSPTLSVDTVTDPNPGDTVQYRFVIADNPNFTTPVVTTAWQSTPSYTVPSGTLDGVTTYWWRVETQDNHGATTVPSSGFRLRRTALGYNGFSGYFKGLNTLGGNYVFTETDAHIASVGPALELSRTFNTADTFVGVFGKGWSTPYFMSWTLSGSNVIITYPDGRRESHTPDGTGGWTPPPGYNAILSGTPADGLTLHMGDNSLYEFTSGGTTGRLSKITDPAGHVLTIDYTNFSSSPQRVVIRDEASQRAFTAYVSGTLAAFRINSVDVPKPGGGVYTWTYTYDNTYGDQRLTSACDARGTTGYCMTYTWESGAAGRLWKVFDRKGQLDAEFGYSTYANRITSIKDASGNTTGFTYYQQSSSPYEIQVTMTDARTNTWRHDYDQTGLFIRDYVPGVATPWTYTYNATTRMRTSTADPNGNSSTLTYTADLRVKTETNGEGKTSYRVYDDVGNVIKTCDARSVDANSDGVPDADTYCTISDYGSTTATRAQGLIRSRHENGLASETWTYTTGTEAPYSGAGTTIPAGLIRTHTDVAGRTTFYDYYANGDVARVSDNAGPGGGGTGTPTRYEAESATTNNTNLLDPIGGASNSSAVVYTQYWYNYVTFTVSVPSAGTYNLDLGYSAPAGDAHRKLTVNGTVVTNHFLLPNTGWAWGSVATTATLNAGSNTITFTTDEADGSDGEAYFDYLDVSSAGSTGVDTRFVYDALGRLTTKTDVSDTFPSGVATTYTYDAVNNRLTETQPSVTNAVTTVAHQAKTTWTYDANSNVADIAVSDLVGGDATRTTHNDYDTADRLWQTTDAEGGVTQRRFDTVGNVVHVRDGEGRWLRSTYNARNQLTKLEALGVVADPDTATPIATLSQTEYDDGGRRTATIDARGQRVEYGYDHADRPTTVVQKNYRDDLPSGSTRDVRLTENVYDAAGHPTTVKEGAAPGGAASRTTTFTYDNAGRLTTTSNAATGRTQTLTLDDAGRVLTNAVARTGVQTGGVANAETRYSYDVAGRVLSATVENGTADLTTTFTYDSRGVRTSTVAPRGNVGGGTPANFKTTYVADELGRTYKTISPQVAAESNGGAPSNVTPTVTTGFNTFGNATQLKDERGFVTTTAYDKLSRVTTITYATYTPPGGTAITPSESFTYDDVGNQTSHTDRRGQTTNYTFDIYNHPISQLDPAVGADPRGEWTKTYDLAGNLTSVTDPTGAQTTFTYDSRNRPRKQTEIVRAVTVTPQTGAPGPQSAQTIVAASYDTVVDHDDLGRVTKSTSPEGVVTTTTFNEADEPTAIADTATTTIAATSYDVFGHPVRVTDALGRQVRFAYDQAGRPISQGRYANNSASTPITQTQAGYDADGNLTTAISGNNATSTIAYDALGRVVSISQPVTSTKNITASYGYDEAGNLTRKRDGRAYNPAPLYSDSFTAANGTAWAATNWATGTSTGGAVDVQSNSGHLKAAAVGSSWARAGDDATSPRAASSQHRDAELTATVKAATVAGGLTSRLWMRASGTWAAASTLQTNGYNLSLNQAAGTVAIKKTVSSTETQLTSAALAFAANTTYKVRFQAVGSSLKAKIWNAANTEPAGWTLTTTDSALTAGVTAVSVATGSGNAAVRDVYVDDYTVTPAGTTPLAVYDVYTTYNPWGLPQDLIEPPTASQPNANQRTYTTAYDAGGLPIRDIAPDGGTGLVTTNTYDELGRLTTQTAGTDSRAFTYDPAGRRISSSHPAGTQTYLYDDRSLMVGAVGPAGNTIARYNGDHQPTYRDDAAGNHAFTYNNLGLPDTIADPATGTTLHNTYNTAHQLTRIDYGTPGAGTPYRTYGYDNAGRRNSDVLKVGATTKYDASYTFDGDNNILTETVKNLYGSSANDETYTYTYDLADRLTSDSRKIGTGTPTVTNYTWDDAGNRTSAGTKTWTYDERGRILNGPDGNYTWDPSGTLDKITSATGGVTDYTYDALGRQTKYMNGATIVDYTYDALDRVYTRASAGTTASFAYAGMAIDPSATITTGTTKSYTRGPDGGLLGVKNGATAVFAGLNKHGDVRFLMDTSGTATDTKTYDPFGKTIASTGTTDQDLGYQGDYTDPTTADVWMGARWYSPTNATFRSRDTYAGQTSNPISLNRYTYAGANPLRFFDSNGHQHWEIDPVMDEACAITQLQDVCNARAKLVPDPGDVCGIGAIYDQSMNCITVCDAACFHGIIAGLTGGASLEYEQDPVAYCAQKQGYSIALDGTCVKNWEPGDPCGTNGIRGLDLSCVERQAPGTPCEWNGTPGFIGGDQLTCRPNPAAPSGPPTGPQPGGDGGAQPANGGTPAPTNPGSAQGAPDNGGRGPGNSGGTQADPSGNRPSGSPSAQPPAGPPAPQSLPLPEPTKYRVKPVLVMDNDSVQLIRRGDEMDILPICAQGPEIYAGVSLDALCYRFGTRKDEYSFTGTLYRGSVVTYKVEGVFKLEVEYSYVEFMSDGQPGPPNLDDLTSPIGGDGGSHISSFAITKVLSYSDAGNGRATYLPGRQTVFIDPYPLKLPGRK